MKKILALISILALSFALVACGGSDNSAPTSAETPAENSTEAATSTIEAEVEEISEEANGMDLSIYPSSNIAAFEASAGAKPTYDELYARIEASVTEVEDLGDDLGKYYRDANGNILLAIQYDNRGVSIIGFTEYYEDGTEKGYYYTNGLGDSVAYQLDERDVNGQPTRRAYRSSRNDVEFTSNTVYDYHANGNIARENSYDDTALHSAIVYNESGSPLSQVFYENGAEEYRTDYAYDADNKLLQRAEYDEGVLEHWTTYEYDANGKLTKFNEYLQSIGAEAPYKYSLVECFDNGNISKEASYYLDEGLYLGYAGDPQVVYNLYSEVEYYENGNYKKEFRNESTYMDNDEYAAMYMNEYSSDGYMICITYFDSNGNVIGVKNF